MTTCGHFSTALGVCGETPVRLYLVGHRCAAHTPSRLAGRPEPSPAPGSTLEGLRRAARADQTRARLRREQLAAEPPGWDKVTPPLVSPTGWVSRPGRRFTAAAVDMGAVHRAERRVGDELTRRAQIRRAEAAS